MDTQHSEARSSLEQEKNEVDTPNEVESNVDTPVKDKEDETVQTRSTSRIALIMLSLCLATFLSALDVSIVTTALPSIAEAFTSSSAYQWIGSAYLLATAAATPVWGKVSDIFGRKPTLIAANVIFLVGSLVAALANSVGMLLAARAVQGLGGGGLLVLCNIVIGDLFSEAERANYYGVLGGVWAVALALGPILGGVFSQHVTWRWCFYINLPIDGLALAVLIVFLDIKTPRTPLKEGLLAVDWLGSLLIMGGTLMFLFGLEYGGKMYAWDSVAVICLIVFGVVTIVLFGVVEWKIAKYPVIPLRIFTSRTSLACFGANIGHGLAMIGALFYLPLFFQSALNATPTLSGVYLLAIAISMAVGAIAGGAFIGAVGNARLPIYIGLALMTLGFGLFIDLKPDSSWAKIIIYQIICGLGIGPIFQAPLIVLQSVSAPEDVGTATSSFEFARNLATAISVVVGGVIFDNSMISKRPSLQAHLPASIVQLLTSGEAGAATEVIHRLPQAQRLFAQNEYSDALRGVWYFSVALSAVALASSFFISRKELSKEHKETETGLEAEEANRQRALRLKAENALRKALPGTTDASEQV